MNKKDFEYEQAAKLRKEKQFINLDIIVNDEEPYTLYKTSDLSVILSLKTIRTSIYKYPQSEKVLRTCHTPGGDQQLSYLTYNGLLRLLQGLRNKSASKCILDILGIQTVDRVFTCIEEDTLGCIQKAFKNEEMILQYRILHYKVDLYFPKYLLICECDEKHHYKVQNKANDAEREENIKKSISGCVFIRFRPHEKSFCIFDVINQIYVLISTKK